jgi:tight adherence protein B
MSVTQERPPGQNSNGGSIFARLRETGGEREQFAKQLADTLDRAGIQNKPQELAGGAAAIAAVLWFALVFLMRPGPIVGVLLALICAAAAFGGLWIYVQMKLRKRLDTFIQQLEMALRLIASGVRIGLALRQALTMVIEEMSDPARYEFMRIVGQTNIGVSVYDALDGLAKRMPGNETLMMARAIRIQSQTGGDLSKILEHLAETIKERRRIQRKIAALTAEGRASAGILAGLPPFLTGFISLTEPAMGHALFFTGPGHVALGIVFVLESLGVFTLLRMLKVDV